MSKVRNGFVSNSSSSSFVIIKAGNNIILEDGDSDLRMCGNCTLNIDDLIIELQKAKDSGVKRVEISHGGGYNG